MWISQKVNRVIKGVPTSIYIPKIKVPNDLSGAEISWKNKKTSYAQLEFDEKLGVYVNPEAIQHYNQIQDKVGIVKSQMNITVEKKLSERIKDCLIPGRKHCLPSEQS